MNLNKIKTIILLVTTSLIITISLLQGFDNPRWFDDFIDIIKSKNVETTGNSTRFLNAMRTRDVKTIRKLLEEGFDVNTPLSNERMPLTEASTLGYADVVEVLLEAGAHVDFQTKSNGKTALMYAGGVVDIVKLLLEAKANVDLQDSYGNTALMYAVKWRNLETIKTLMRGPMKPDLQIKNNQGLTALDMARDPKIKMLLEAFNENQHGNFTELYQAIISNDFNKVTELAPAIFGYWGNCTPNKQLALEIAQTLGTVEMYQFLCEIWDVPSKDSWKSTAVDLMEWVCYLNP